MCEYDPYLSGELEALAVCLGFATDSEIVAMYTDDQISEEESYES